MDTHVYIDGFNLYYGLLKGKPFKWLNLETFCDLLLPKNRVQKIHYFTARVDARPHDPDQPIRQETYLRALATLPRVQVHFGNFLGSVTRQPMVEPDPAKPGFWLRGPDGKPVLKTEANGRVAMGFFSKSEEKGSDVNLAAYLLKDAFQKRCQCAVIISNDSDLLTPIRIAKADCGTTIGLVLPRPKGSVELKSLGDFQAEPRTHHLQRSQFPNQMNDAVGAIHKPPNW